MSVFGGITVVMALESSWPLRPAAEAPLWRWVNNLALNTLEFAVSLGIGPWVGWLALQMVGNEHRGLLQGLGASPWLSFTVLLLSLQFTAYWLHRAMHRIPLLWRIHAVHHCDPEVDATTAFRHHPFEVILSVVVNVAVIMPLMPEPSMLLAYNVLQSIVAIVHHGNITFGVRLDRLLRLFIVTPDFHRVHHSSEREYTDSNYATLSPLFDYLFGTAKSLPLSQQKNMELGLAYFREAEYTRLDKILLIPFQPPFGATQARTAP